MTDPKATDPIVRIEAVEAVVRRNGARLAQIEDAISIYGVPKRRTLPIPELTREQRNTVLVMCLVAIIPLLSRIGSRHA